MSDGKLPSCPVCGTPFWLFFPGHCRWCRSPSRPGTIEDLEARVAGQRARFATDTEAAHDLATMLETLSVRLQLAGRKVEAVEIAREAVAAQYAVSGDYGGGPHEYVQTVGRLCRLLRENGRWAEAEQAAAEVVDPSERRVASARATAGSDHPGHLARALSDLGETLGAVGLTARSVAVLRDAASSWRYVVVGDPGYAWRLRSVLLELAERQAELEMLEEALASVEQADAILVQNPSMVLDPAVARSTLLAALRPG